MPVSSSRADGLGCCEQQPALGLGPGEESATAEQSAAAELGRLKMLDVQEVADRWVQALSLRHGTSPPHRHKYVLLCLHILNNLKAALCKCSSK
jgi:hypothetical protein